MEAIKTKFTGMERYTTPDPAEPEHEYEKYIKLTSKLIERTYIATAKMVEKWSLDTIKRRYHDASKDSKPAMRWWVLRKKNI